MRKQIDGSTKYETVCQIEAGKISIRHAAEQRGVHPSSVQAWVRLYKTEGISGFAKQKNQVYSEALKVKAVEDYLSVKGSLAAICKKYKIRARIQLQNWLKVYHAHGDFNSRKNSGGGNCMKQGRDTTQEERIQIVKDCLVGGKNYSEMALKYKVSYQQVRIWTLRFEEMGEAGLEDRRGKRKKDQEPRTELEAAQIENDDLRHDHGIHVNDKRVLRICRARDIRSTIKYNNHGCTRQAKSPQYIAENLLNRQFYADKPNEKWLTDVTEFKWFEGMKVQKLYLSAILDLCDRRIVSYVLSERNDNLLVFKTFDKAVQANPDAHPLFHSDRGFQYTNRTFHQMLEDAGMMQSMSRVAYCIDNGPMDGFWGILMRERYYGRRFTCKRELVQMIETYIHYYNTRRVQRNLGVLTPMEKHELGLAA